ncbi:MAG: hypothetical protein IJC18_03520, partial [Clostridia bacterium]|nr:hypothetical protein [Clostridia bacterium]
MKKTLFRIKILRLAASILAATILLLPLAACEENEGGVDYGFSYSLTANPKNLDPQMANDNNSLLVIKNIFEGLMRTDSTGALIYGVAQSYTVNPEDTEYTFELRRDAKWSNGTPVTAYDFEFAWKRALQPETQSATCESLYCIRNAEAINKGKEDISTLGVTVIDTYTLKVVLEYPYAEFPLQTTMAVYMPCNEEFFNATSGHYGLEDKYIISNGPFCFATTADFLEEDNRSTAWNPDNYVRMIRNEYYKGENPCLPRILYLGIRKADADYFTMLTDETVEAAKIESQNVLKLDETDFRTYSYTDCTWGILFNTRQSGFENSFVRQGFSMCVSDDMYREYLADNTEIAYDIIPPVTKLNGVLYRELAGSGMKIKSDLSGAYNTYKKGLEQLELKK